MKKSTSCARARPWWVPCLLLSLALALALPLARAGNGSKLIYAAGEHTDITIPIYKSRIVELPRPVSRISIGNPNISDVLIIDPYELYVLGKSLGSTNILLWTRHNFLLSAISITVSPDLAGLRAMLRKVLPGEHVGVTSAQKNIVLYGTVDNVVDMDAALRIAKSYLEANAGATKQITFRQSGGGGHSGRIINLLKVKGPQQVMLQVRVAEVQRNAAKNMNLQVLGMFSSGKFAGGADNGGALFPEGTGAPLLHGGSSGILPPAASVIEQAVPQISTAGLFGSYLSGSFMANAVLDAFVQQGLAHILAEPTLTTESGRKAQFLSGGQFPIPIPEENGAIGIEYKSFGVKLAFLPVVLSDGRINLQINVSVSELTSTNSLVVSPITSSSVFAVPALTERQASATVELADGQSIGIAGLLNDTMQTAVKKFPGLGDIPILGQLFRSQQFQEGRTELVILVTPHLAKALGPGEARLPSEGVTAPSDAGFFLLGRLHGSPPPPVSAPAPAPAPAPTPAAAAHP